MWGSAYYLFFYIVCGISGVVLSVLLSPSTVSVGASGALFGFIGEDIAQSVMKWSSLDATIKWQKGLQWAMIIIFSLSFSNAERIDNWAHLGGA